MNKKLIPLSLACLLGIVALGACQKPAASSSTTTPASSTTTSVASSASTSSTTSTPASSTTTSSSAETVYSLAISNKTDLTKEWHDGDDNRTIALTIAPEVNVLALITSGDLKVVSSDPTVVFTAGLNLTPLKVGTATVTVTLFGKYSDTVDLTVTAEVFNTISEITKDGFYNVRGVVAALTTSGFILADGTAGVYVYLSGTPSYKIGDKLKVSQTLSSSQQYNGFYQFTSSAKITAITGDYAEAAAIPLTAAIADTFAGVANDPTAMKKYSWTTTCAASGTYTVLPLEGSSVVIENTYTPTALTPVVGKKYDVEGYFYGYASKYKYAAFALTKLTPVFDPITSIAIEADQSVCAVGGTDQMTATILPATAHQEITWSVANKDTTVTDTLATIDTSGLLSGVKAGVVVVSATSTADTTKVATVEVTIFDATDPVTGISLDQSTLSVYATLTKTLKATITSSGTAFLDAETWTSSDPKIATVDKKGVVTGIKAGTATITATTVAKDAEGKQLSATCEVTVVTATVGTEAAPLSVSALLESAPVFCAQENGAFGKDMVYVTGKVTSVSYGASYSAGKYTIIIADPADSTKTIKATGVDYTGDAQAIFVNDTVVIHHYLEFYKSYALYFNKDASGNKLYGSVLSRTAGTSTITLAGADNATVTGLEATYTNDATATFDVAAKTGYVLDSVSVGTTALTADATSGKYSFVVEGDVTVTIVTHAAGQAATLTKSIVAAANKFTAASDSLSATLTDDPVTLKLEKNTSSTALRLSDADHVRIYAGAKFTVTLGSGTLQSIKFTCPTAAYATTLGGLTFTGGTAGTVAATDVDVTVTASAGSNVVSFVVGSTQTRVSSIVVTYVAA